MYDLIQRNIEMALLPEWSGAFAGVQPELEKMSRKIKEIRTAEGIYKTNLHALKTRHNTLPKRLSQQDKTLVLNQINAVKKMVAASEELRQMADEVFEGELKPELFKIFSRYMGEDEQGQQDVYTTARNFFESQGFILDPATDGEKPSSAATDDLSIWESAHTEELKQYNAIGDAIVKAFNDEGGIGKIIKDPERLIKIKKQTTDPNFAALIAVSRAIGYTKVEAKQMEGLMTEQVIDYYLRSYPDLADSKRR